MIEITPDGQIHYEKVVKGDYISEEVLRKVTGFDPRENPDVYTFAVLKIREKLEEDFDLLSRGEGTALRVLTTNESTYYAVEQAQQARERQRRNLRRLLKLDEQEMDENTRLQHRKHINQETEFDSARKSAWKKIRISQARQPSNRIPDVNPVKITSTRRKEDGATGNQDTADRNKTITASQRAHGQSSESDGQKDERIDQ